MRFLFLLISLTFSIGSFARECYRFDISEAPKYLGERFIGPKAPLGICFKKGVRTGEVMFYLTGEYTGVYLFGPLKIIADPACTGVCSRYEGSHFYNAIKLVLIRQRENTAVLHDVLRKRSFQVSRMSASETDHILDF